MGLEFRFIFFACLLAVVARAADADLQAILKRLEKLESENAQLRSEVQALKDRLGPPSPIEAPPLAERVAVNERRIEEQEQTKVSSAERAPLRLTGMVLWNVFSSGRNGAPAGFPTVATANRGANQIRGTFRQTSIGLEVESPTPVLGALARGSLMTDFYASYDDYLQPRIRTASVDLEWKTRSLRFGIEKPIVAPRNPTSLANVIYPALWGAGNLWIWEPQVRLEQRMNWGTGWEARAQAGLFQTNESRVSWVAPFAPQNLPPRSGWQGRFQIGRALGEDRRIEIAPGFHYSRTLVVGATAPSRLFTADWLIAPATWWDITGAFFKGENAAPLGGLRQGVVITGPGEVRSVQTSGGWTQLALRPASWVGFHLMAGQQDDRNRDLLRGGIGRNLSYAVNGIFRLSPNVLISLEAQQIRTTYIGTGLRLLNRYDLGVAYLF